ncbi:MAG: transglutaminase domain-containing protein, partial [Alistipes sp.]
MKKFAKITGIVLFSLIGVLIVLFLLSRYVFREQVVDYLTEQQQNERVELLRNANPYAADTTQFRFTYTQDTLRAQALRIYFRLDTLLRADVPTWDNAVALAKFVAGNIPHANQTVYPEKSNAIALWEYHLNIEPAFNCRLHSILLHEL